MIKRAYCQHQSESQCIAHMALISVANPQFSYDYENHPKLGWAVFWDYEEITYKHKGDEDE